MTQKERDRKVILEGITHGRFNLREASERMGISYRQVKRINGRYQTLGDVGLVHRSRGRASNRAFDEAMQAFVFQEYQSKYEGFGPTLAAEKISEQGLKIHSDTLRKWLLKAGLWTPQRKRSKHRLRRKRKERFGELVQMDGSIHKWFYGQERYDCLMNLVDDATGTTFSLLAEGETTEASMKVLQGWIEQYGIPKELYVDLKSVYVGKQRLSDEELVAQDSAFVVFAESCRRLGIKIRRAYSPQAKGRVERSHGVYQDRLVKEIKLRGLKTIAEVNELLHNGFISDLNSRFAKTPASSEDAHQELNDCYDLYNIFCWDALRVLQNDSTIRHQNIWYQVKKTGQLCLMPKTKVTIRRHLDGAISLWAKNTKLNFSKIGLDKPKVCSKTLRVPLLPSERSEIARKNSALSPWRQFKPGWLTQTKVAKKEACYTYGP